MVADRHALRGPRPAPQGSPKALEGKGQVNCGCRVSLVRCRKPTIHSTGLNPHRLAVGWLARADMAGAVAEEYRWHDAASAASHVNVRGHRPPSCGSMDVRGASNRHASTPWIATIAN